MNWGVLRVYETHEAHSGYEPPCSMFRIIPFGLDASYHIFHHTKNVGNYSTFMTIWDTVFNTNQDYYEQYPGGASEQAAKPVSQKLTKEDQADPQDFEDATSYFENLMERITLAKPKSQNWNVEDPLDFEDARLYFEQLMERIENATKPKFKLFDKYEQAVGSFGFF